MLRAPGRCVSSKCLPFPPPFGWLVRGRIRTRMKFRFRGPCFGKLPANSRWTSELRYALWVDVWRQAVEVFKRKPARASSTEAAFKLGFTFEGIGIAQKIKLS